MIGREALSVLAGVADLPVANVNQVAFVVRNVDAAVRAWHERLGVGGWQIYTYGPEVLRVQTYHGKPSAYRMRLAFAWCANLQLEVIEPIQGPSIYEDFLRAHGEGMHHIGIFVEDFPAAVERLCARGYEQVMTGEGFGLHGDGAFAYFDGGPLATTIELISPPAARRPPDGVYPPVEPAPS